MALNLQAILNAPIIELDTIDSTNNYAMRLVNADKAQPGLTVVARQQTQGKGQREKTWTDSAGESLLMSLVTTPGYTLEQQFLFNVATTTAIAQVLEDLHQHWHIHIKWPNDIIINDKKAGGVLIENIIRGSQWMYGIIGLGLNINQELLGEDLPYATSLRIASGKSFAIEETRDLVRENILKYTFDTIAAEKLMEQYNERLYRKDRQQQFSNEKGEWMATIVKATHDGRLEVLLNDGNTAYYTHGSVLWQW